MSISHALALARFNWPLYLACFVTVAIGLCICSRTTLPSPVRGIALLGAGIAAWYAIASFVAFHLMFDRSNFLSGKWLSRCVPRTPCTCVQLSVCIEQTTLPIEQVFPTTTYTNLDLFDDSLMTEPAIARAKLSAEPAHYRKALPSALPMADGSSDLTVVTLAAHEIRDPHTRNLLFHELARITSSAGQVVVAEHLRNLSAVLAFGPGLFHFYPRREWTTLATSAGFHITSEFDITPFIHVFILERK